MVIKSLNCAPIEPTGVDNAIDLHQCNHLRSSKFGYNKVFANDQTKLCCIDRPCFCSGSGKREEKEATDVISLNGQSSSDVINNCQLTEIEGATDVININGQLTNEAGTMTIMQLNPAAEAEAVSALKLTAATKSSMDADESTVTTSSTSSSMVSSSPEVTEDDEQMMFMSSSSSAFFQCPPQTEPLDLTNYAARREREAAIDLKRPHEVTTSTSSCPMQQQIKAAEAMALAAKASEQRASFSPSRQHWKKWMVARYYEDTGNSAGALDLSVKNNRSRSEE